jgi:hypothetical protein
MRDTTISAMQEASAKRDFLLLRQVEFINTRMQAYEDILSTRSGILRLLLNPKRLRRHVDEIHQKYLQRAQAEYHKAKTKVQLVKPV